jgi:TetR/AcrR family transcriptional regulator, transcriptional repressor for nem operon
MTGHIIAGWRQSLREQIIESALTQFSQKGFNGAVVKDITDAAGAPKGSFYNHFDSKEALAVAVLERYGSRRGLEALARPGASARARLRAHFEERRAERAWIRTRLPFR